MSATMKKLGVAVIALLVGGYAAFSLAIFRNHDSGTSNERWVPQQNQPSGQPADLDAAYSKLGTQLGAGQFDQMIATAGEAISQHSRVAPLHYMRGFAYLQKKELDQSIQDFNTALEINPEYADAYRFRGMAYKEKNDLDRALADANRACELDPGNPENFTARAIAYLTKGDRKQALLDAETVLKLDPKSEQGAFLVKASKQ